MKSLQLATLIALAIPTAAFAQGEPIQDVAASRHRYLARAQSLSRQAYDQLTAAQNYNKDDMKGHAAKAKALLDQVNSEIRLATDAANAADAQHQRR